MVYKSIHYNLTIAFFSLCLLSSCTNFTQDSLPPSFSLVSINVVESTVFEQTLEIGLRVKNPNDHPINVRGATAVMEINSIPFADGFINQGQTIKPYSDQVFTIVATTNLLRVLKQIGKIAETGIVSYSLSGGLKVDNLITPIPFDETGELSLNELFPAFEQLRK